MRKQLNYSTNSLVSRNEISKKLAISLPIRTLHLKTSYHSINYHLLKTSYMIVLICHRSSRNIIVCSRSLLMTAPVAKFLLRAVLMIQAQVLALTIHLLTQTGTSDSELGFQKGVPKGCHKGSLMGGVKNAKIKQRNGKFPGNCQEVSWKLPV